MVWSLSNLLKRKGDSAPPTERFDSIYRQGLAEASNHDFERALYFFDRAIELQPSHAEAHYKRANALRSLGRPESAVASYTQAIEHQPDYAFAYCNRGVVQQSLGLTSEALASYDRALELNPADALTHYNRALLLQETGRWDEALAGYAQAISINPEYADAQFNRAMALLFCGDFERGWPAHEWRWKIAHRLGIGEAKNFSEPLWLGERPVKGKRVLLHSEAGLGDTIQFCRYVPKLAALGARVYLEVQAPLLGLLENLPGVTKLMPKGCVLPEFDLHCPLMSLPLAFSTSLTSIPAADHYLQGDAAAIDRWRLRLPVGKRRRVGLVWSGNADNMIDRRRSIALSDWAAHLPPEFEYFRLQKDVREADVAALSANPFIKSFNDDGDLDFVNTAALIQCMDVVLTVDTSIAHLSGALGQRTWILLPFMPDWRWLRDRDDSPWYPSVRLYRQSVAGDWRSVFDRIAADLRRDFASG